MPKFVDITGKTFGRLRVIERAVSPKAEAQWRCLCDCGNEKVVGGYNLRSGFTRSCGCFHKEQFVAAARAKATTHGMTNSPTYRSWRAMLTRCTRPQAPASRTYFHRGVTVCDAWLRDFSAFLAGVGPRPPGMTLDRIDNTRGYEPGNCRWATPKEQMNNRGNNVLITYKGETLTVMQWAERLKVPHSRLLRRHRYGWPHDRIIEQPGRFD